MKNGLYATEEVLGISQKNRKKRSCFLLYNRGSSALMTYPAEGISLPDKQLLNKLLLTCGANIIEINSVRKHLSQIKGGRLAKSIHPQAHLINLTVSDVIERSFRLYYLPNCSGYFYF